MGARLIVCLIALTLVGCGSHRQGSPAAASCTHPSRIDSAPGIGGPEIVGQGTGAQLWGLLMAPRYPLVAREGVVKIVWRMTGRGALTLAEYTGSGRPIPLAWGPQAHGASNYPRPGDEWGAGYVFDAPGCYRLTARRARGSAEVWLRVRAPA